MKKHSARTCVSAASLAALAFFSSCWHPAFDPDISGSEAVIRKLGTPILWFTAEDVEGHLAENTWFLPNSTAAPSTGLFLRREEDRVRINPAGFDSVLHTGILDSFNGREVPNVYGDLYTAYATPNGNTEAFLAAEPTLAKYINPMSPPTLTDVPLPPATSTYGLGLVSSVGINQVRFLWIGFQASSLPGFYSGFWMGGAPGFGPSTDLVFSDNAFVSRAGRAFTNSMGHFYLSCGLTDGTRAIFRWTNPMIDEPSRFPEIYGPLVGALSDDRLLAEKDGVLSVLDPDLRRLFSFPAGRLRFVQERWDGTMMWAVFTRTIFVRTSGKDDRGRLKVEVYEIPSAQLVQLSE